MKTGSTYRTYIFDLDGTLLNTLGDLYASCNFALQACNMPARTYEEVRSFVGNGVRKLMSRAVPMGEDNPAFEEAFLVFKKHYLKYGQTHTVPYDGIMDLLHELKNRNFQIAVVSNKFHLATRELCQHFFGDLVDMAIGEHDGFRKKPNPDMVYEVMKFLHADPQETVYIGDSDVDIMTAKNSGLPCVSVLWGFRDRSFLVNHGATCLIETPDQLLNI